MPNPAVVFDRANLELRTVRFHFLDTSDSVEIIRWQPGISSGATIQVGQTLATIVWTSGASEPIDAPNGCEGTVESTNRQIPYLELDEWGVWLLSLRR